MKHVLRPPHSARETYLTSISRVRNKTQKNNLESIEGLVTLAANDYSILATVPSLHTTIPMAMVGVVSKDELVNNYDNRFAKKGSPGRYIYDELKSLPDGDICPYCNHRDISTLDHFLPKTIYPILAVTPDNLIGVCSDCNKKKGDGIPTSLAETFIHPYFEDIPNVKWLHADVLEKTTPAVRFNIHPPQDWDIILTQRVINQFDILQLGPLYSNQAAREMNDIREGLKTHFKNEGPGKVYQELEHQWHSRRANQLNSWQTALYEALKNSQWYWQGGFDF